MKPGENGSAQLRVGKYLLGKLQSDTPQLSKKELMEACAVKEKKTVGAIFRVHFRGMFGIESDDIYPKYGDFEGKDGFWSTWGLLSARWDNLQQGKKVCVKMLLISLPGFVKDTRGTGGEEFKLQAAGVVGIEPTLQVLETRGLPLTDTP